MQRIGRPNIDKILVFLNLTYRFNAILVRIPESYFMNINELILKFIWRRKKETQKSQRKAGGEQSRGPTAPSREARREAAGTEAVWRGSDRHAGPRARAEGPEAKPRGAVG